MNDAVIGSQEADDQDQALRRSVLEIIKQGKSQATCANESGIAMSTFSAWLNNTYNGDNSKVSAKVRNWLSGQAERAKTRSIMPSAPPFVLTESARKFLHMFSHAQYAPELVVLAGAPGLGKTAAVEHYRQKNANVFRITGQPCMKSPRLMLDDLAEEMDIGERPRSSQRMASLLIKRLRNTGGLIMVDEAQHLTSEMFDQLRTLHDLAGVGVAVIGNETVYSRIEGGSRNPAFAQLFSRVGMRQSKSRCTGRDVEQIIAAWDITDRSAVNVLKLIANKPGALRNLTKVMRLAHMIAHGADAVAVSVDHIGDAWEQVSNQRIAATPE